MVSAIDSTSSVVCKVSFSLSVSNRSGMINIELGPEDAVLLEELGGGHVREVWVDRSKTLRRAVKLDNHQCVWMPPLSLCNGIS